MLLQGARTQQMRLSLEMICEMKASKHVEGNKEQKNWIVDSITLINEYVMTSFYNMKWVYVVVVLSSWITSHSAILDGIFGNASLVYGMTSYFFMWFYENILY